MPHFFVRGRRCSLACWDAVCIQGGHEQVCFADVSDYRHLSPEGGAKSLHISGGHQSCHGKCTLTLISQAQLVRADGCLPRALNGVCARTWAAFLALDCRYCLSLRLECVLISTAPKRLRPTAYTWSQLQSQIRLTSSFNERYPFMVCVVTQLDENNIIGGNALISKRGVTDKMIGGGLPSGSSVSMYTCR